MRFIVFGLLIGIQGVYAQHQPGWQFDHPPTTLTLFGKNIVSTALNERDFALSPDGTEIYFTISTPKSSFQSIVYCKKDSDGQWSNPEVASFAGTYSDLEPAFSADGNTLYFSSNRPLVGNKTKDFDIYKVSRSGNSWGNVERLGAVINTDADEFYPSLANNGNLYFTAAYDYGKGKEDIYRAVWNTNQYMKPVSLDTAINSTYYEFNAFVAPDETYLIFTSYGRRDDRGGGDLYFSMKDASGHWLPAKNLKTLNSQSLDYCPYVSPDGKAFFFTSERHQLPTSFNRNNSATYKSIADVYADPLNGNGNIYWIDFSRVWQEIK